MEREGVPEPQQSGWRDEEGFDVASYECESSSVGESAVKGGCEEVFVRARALGGLRRGRRDRGCGGPRGEVVALLEGEGLRGHLVPMELVWRGDSETLGLICSYWCFKGATVKERVYE